ncbi:uncharacterized protein CTRU02_205597 [Colletotrichum truncatum]|uniref:Uncharacterized protein n=1 Tax=Colletotrichum truncatum TaxID=5467 RepID=A0ACC3Z4I2_COLTU|nr:uncharacterized protein CTRU02_09351 [Colletotrichum truncatum]KAF6788543.1 hypothetical protein CTRU02_09351 [Colletotrichum truncatum]
MGLFKSANSPAPSASNRSMTGQSIRGKISGPIPIPNPVDDEFPMRNPGTGIATPVTGGDMREQQMHPPQVDPAARSTVSVPRPEVLQPPRTDSVVAPSGSGSTSTSSPTSATHAHSNSPQSQRRTNASSNLRYSVVSASSEQTGASKDRPQRKKSTLRGALGKLFGRKKKNGSQSSHDSQRVSTYNPTNQNQKQHKSDLSALNRAKESEPKRSASLPITEYDRALRSHSIGPDDITAIESARNSINVDTVQSSRKRAATSTISQIYSAPFRHREGELAGLSPRPASTHVRGSRLFHSDDDDPEEIGRAITSDVGHKRRSRSLSGINNPEIRADLRRRSDEIRYWRQSYNQATIAAPALTNLPDHDNQYTEVAPMDMPESPVSPIEQAQAHTHTPPQPFSFGSLTHLNVMAGMKITQAASIETRIETLEGRMQRMEDIVAQLCNSVPGLQVRINQPDRTAPPVPGPNASSYNSTSVNTVLQQVSHPEGPGSRNTNSAHSKESHTSFGETPTYVGSLHLPASIHRPTSTSTIRGVSSLPALSRMETGRATELFTADHYTMLLALLETERASRQALESQVKKLTRRINMISGPTGNGRLSLQMEPPPTAKSFGSVSAFDRDSSDDDDAALRDRRYLAEDSGVGTGVGDDDSYSEVFATPKEEQPYSYGAFGEELREEDEDPQRKKAARTLSLSQMTLGKKPSRTRV